MSGSGKQALISGSFSHTLRTAALNQERRLDEIIQRLVDFKPVSDLSLAQEQPCPGKPQKLQLRVGDLTVVEATMGVRSMQGGSMEIFSTIEIYPYGRPEGWPELGRPEDARGPCSCYERPRVATDIPCAEHGWLPPGVKLVRYRNTKLDLSKIPRPPAEGEDDV